WYAADQDYGAQHSVFAPFFGIPTATITATSRFAKLSGAAVVPFTHVRTARGIKLILHPPLNTIPSGDEATDAATANAFLEQWLREHPADYLWLHRRFKTRPDEQASLYAAKRARYHGNEVSAKRLAKLLKSARRVSLRSDAPAPVWLTSGNRLVQICSTSLWWRLRQKLAATEWQNGNNSLLPVTVVSPAERWHCSANAASVHLFDPLLRPLTESLGQAQQRRQWLVALAHQFAVLHAAQMRLASPDIGLLVTTSRHELAWLPFGTRLDKRDTADSRLRELAVIAQQCAEFCQAELSVIWDVLITNYTAHAALPEPLRAELNAKSSAYRPGMSS
ncbi:MAG TPA: hypothetical protein VFV64_08565, partial [Permianibacter sp.]|nr:hypothetical protein [Permianibacter sp.]